MSRRLGWIRLGLLPFVPWLAGALRAQEKQAPPKPSESELLLELMDLMDTPVVAASKESQKASEAPAIVSVVTSDDIRHGGFRSVAEALATLPGLYGIDDHLGTNFGIRGIGGGLRAYSRIAKVMIDGQPISFRPDTTNLLGPELIPMEAVERIEVVRGPASALYGANAFLGVVNIVSKSGEGAKSSVLARGSSYRGSPGGGGEGVFASKAGRNQLFVAGSISYLDLSGDRLAAGSPYLGNYPSPETRNDVARPVSLFARWRSEWGKTSALELTGHYSHLDTVAELLDFGTLSHQNRIVQNNAFLRAKYETRFDPVALTVAGAISKGGPGTQERLNSGSTTTFPRRDVGYDGKDLMAEAKWSFGKRNSLTGGVDWTRDTQHLMTVYTVDAATGTETLTSLRQGDKSFQNTGVYAQLMYYPIEALGLTGNVRLDKHNIYGNKTNFRLGSVWQVTSAIHAKALYGTSFKAPAALQLYAQPLYGGDVLGNENLKPESARTAEVEVGWKVSKTLAITVDGYMTKVDDKVELVPVGGNFRPANLGTQDAKGVEGTLQWVFGRMSVMGTYSWQRTDDEGVDPLNRPTKVPTAMYPTHLAHLRWQLRSAGWGDLQVSGLWASERRATDSNISANLGRQPYTLSSYTLLNIAYLRQMDTARLHLRILNLFDKRFAEPGFAGIDLPGRGREYVLSYAVSF